MNDDFDPHDELTAAESAALQALPRQREPDARLEDRTVAALHARGLLGAPARRTMPAWWAAAAAAALAFFAAGYAIGQARGGATAVEWMVAVREADAADRAALVQETGSAYVAAVAALAELEGGAGREQVGPGSEAGTAAVRAAITELVRLRPNDARLVRALEILTDDDAADANASPDLVRRVVWF